MTSYDPDTGAEIWYCDGPTTVLANTPAFSGNLVIASGGYPARQVFCIRADGTGNITNTHIHWRTTRNVAYVPSPIVLGANVYVLSDDGNLACLDLATGKPAWQKRLRGGFSASPVFAGEHFYVPNEAGVTYVFQAIPEFKIVAENKVDDEGGLATPAICGGQIFLRTNRRLYCIGAPPIGTAAR